MTTEPAAGVPSVVVRPRLPVFTRSGRWLVRLSLPWLLLSLLTVDAALNVIGITGPERPVAVRLALAAIGVAPVAVYIFSPVLVRLPGLDWLFVRPQPLAVVDGRGLALRLPLRGQQHFEWERVGSLKFKCSWNGGSELRSPDGELLAAVPDELVHPRPHWRSADTLAESVVQVRPDRYALAPDRPALGRPASFDLRQLVGPGIDPVGWKRSRDYGFYLVLIGLVLVGAAGVLVMVLR